MSSNDKSTFFDSVIVLLGPDVKKFNAESLAHAQQLVQVKHCLKKRQKYHKTGSYTLAEGSNKNIKVLIQCL
jgi:hypothetical protein